jgi:hypothetical protein
MAVVLQRKRKSEAAIRKGQYYYSSERPDRMLTYSIHIERAFEGLVELALFSRFVGQIISILHKI